MHNAVKLCNTALTYYTISYLGLIHYLFVPLVLFLVPLRLDLLL